MVIWKSYLKQGGQVQVVFYKYYIKLWFLSKLPKGSSVGSILHLQ